jgi:hypothetical protein
MFNKRLLDPEFVAKTLYNTYNGVKEINIEYWVSDKDGYTMAQSMLCEIEFAELIDIVNMNQNRNNFMGWVDKDSILTSENELLWKLNKLEI